MPNVPPDIKKAMRSTKPTKYDPPGTRFVNGKKIIPALKNPRPKAAHVGGLRGDVDYEGMDPDMAKTLRPKR